MLKENDLAPIDLKFTIQTQKEKTLKEYLNLKYLVLYFYPKDGTPGCTTEACELRDYNQKIQSIGANILGVSKDSVKSHLKFLQNHSLNFDLVSDTDSVLQKEFGVWQLKKFMGKEYMGTQRSTFILDSTGKILKVWEKVNPIGHAKEVYDFLESLN